MIKGHTPGDLGAGHKPAGRLSRGGLPLCLGTSSRVLDVLRRPPPPFPEGLPSPGMTFPRPVPYAARWPHSAWMPTSNAFLALPGGLNCSGNEKGMWEKGKS